VRCGNSGSFGAVYGGKEEDIEFLNLIFKIITLQCNCFLKIMTLQWN
jgi:hypothetical protein